MAVNYMDRLAALRGDRQHAAGAHGSVRSAPVLHADEEKKRAKKKKWKGTKKQRAALAKGQRKLAAMRRAAKKGKSMPKKRKKSSSKRKSPRRGYKSAAARKTARLAKLRAQAHKQGKRVRKRKSKGVTTYSVVPKRKRKKSKRAAPKRTAMSKKKRKKSKGGRKSPKRVAAGKKAARTRKRHKAERAAARRRGGGRKRRGGHKRGSHKRRRGGRKRSSHRGKRRAAPRRRRRGGRARRRSKGLVRRSNRSGKFVGRGGRIHGRKRRGGYHKAGRILREGYAMENPLGMSELATGLLTGLVGYIAADLTDRYLAAGRPPLGGTLYAEASPIYSDYLRLGVGLGMAIVPLAGAHFLDGNKHAHIRAALQFFGFGAGIRTLGHLFNDVVAGQLKNNSMVGSTVQALYPHEIVSQAQLAGAQRAIAAQGAGALPEHIGAEAQGLGLIPEGLAACCNASSRMLNPSLSPLQPIGRSAEGGGAAANYAPPPVALPPPIERVVQQPFTPPQDRTRQATPIPMTPMQPPPPAFQPQPQVPPARTVVVQAPAAQQMAAAYAPVAPLAASGPASGGVNGLPQGPFGWGEDAPG